MRVFTKVRLIRYFFKLIFLEPFFFIYAGQGEKGRSLGDLNVLNIYDPDLMWKKVRIEQPSARHQHSMVGFRQDSPKYKEKKMYLFGGINMPDNILFDDFWVIDFSKAEFDPKTQD